MALKRISLVWIYVTSWSRAVDFYTRTLGLKLRFESPNEWAELSVGEGHPTFGLHAWHPEGKNGVRGAEEIPRGGGATVTFEVESLSEQMGTLVKRGVQFISGREGHDAQGVHDIPNHGRLATFHDPDGNRLQLFEPLRA
jgi:catechol 2,3-dioxygenase-like lactoylglutathione lyase family enzyme